MIRNLCCYYCKKTTTCWRLRWWPARVLNQCIYIFFRHNAIDSVNITFICKGKPKNSCNSLYCISAGVWTHSLSEVCLHLMNKYLVSMSINILPYFHSLPLYDVSGGSGRQGTFIYTVDWVWISDELGVISFTEAGPLPWTTPCAMYYSETFGCNCTFCK